MAVRKRNVEAAKEAKGTPQMIEIKQLQRSQFKVFLMGDTPLIVQAWSQKAKLEILKKHMQQIRIREAKDPQDHFLRSIYRMEDGQYGFPVVGVKEAMATAAADLEGIHRPDIYKNIFCTGRRGFQRGAFADILSPIELAELFSPNAPTIREDMVKLSGIGRTPDLRYRAEFWPWCLRLNIGYIDSFISAESIFNLLHHAGFRVGLAEWRQEKGGNSGAFHVADAHETKQCEKWAAAKQKEPALIDVKAWLQTLQPEPKQEHAGVTLVAASQKRGRKRSNGEHVGEQQ